MFITPVMTLIAAIYIFVAIFQGEKKHKIYIKILDPLWVIIFGIKIIHSV